MFWYFSFDNKRQKGLEIFITLIYITLRPGVNVIDVRKPVFEKKAIHFVKKNLFKTLLMDYWFTDIHNINARCQCHKSIVKSFYDYSSHIFYKRKAYRSVKENTKLRKNDIKYKNTAKKCKTKKMESFIWLTPEGSLVLLCGQELLHVHWLEEGGLLILEPDLVHQLAHLGELFVVTVLSNLGGQCYTKIVK